jgi:hypothetical protein
MSESRENPKTESKEVKRKLIRDEKTGLLFLSGPTITKEKVQKEFPFDSDRDAIIIRRSVGL